MYIIPDSESDGLHFMTSWQNDIVPPNSTL